MQAAIGHQQAPADERPASAASAQPGDAERSCRQLRPAGQPVSAALAQHRPCTARDLGMPRSAGSASHVAGRLTTPACPSQSLRSRTTCQHSVGPVTQGSTERAALLCSRPCLAAVGTRPALATSASAQQQHGSARQPLQASLQQGGAAHSMEAHMQEHRRSTSRRPGARPPSSAALRCAVLCLSAMWLGSRRAWRRVLRSPGGPQARRPPQQQDS